MISAERALDALGDPTRRLVFKRLREGNRSVQEIADGLKVSRPAVSQHLRVLKSAGVVHGERHGREVMYRLVDEHLAHIVVDAVTHVEEGGAAVRGEHREEA